MLPFSANISRSSKLIKIRLTIAIKLNKQLRIDLLPYISIITVHLIINISFQVTKLL